MTEPYEETPKDLLNNRISVLEQLVEELQDAVYGKNTRPPLGSME